ncbi:leucine--tRNA ligase, cytoplasmic-like [Silene latifolia]|uniref:leucine--tRNA ligase, cytoplasmic-like n=1 Tax=Silene latifolia TaxID=37657 RepID=UPI003D77ABB0
MAEGSKSSRKRDKLLKRESKVRSWWDEHDVFVSEPGDHPPKLGEKFFGNFPFPYMNGYLHLGHAFSLSKVEFAAAYHRLRGANVLFPFGFHCTGMPIKAAADKLAREIEQFGNPPVFPAPAPGPVQEQVGQLVEQVAAASEGDKFKGKKSKVVAKTGTQVYQWEIMRSFGLSDEEIAKFQDPYKWLTYFPPLAVEDLKAFGLGVDWRRSFVTTDVNQFFDSFVRWQMRKLKAAGKIVKDLRYTIFSPLDGQPCADHDRASGEGVQPQEYTVIKMEVVPPFPANLSALEGKKVFLAAATLRPETMYGQTNAWVLPDGEYGAFEINEEEVFIITKRAARNLAYQRYSRIPGKSTCLVEVVGSDLIGLPLKSPLSYNKVIYALPMLSISTDKGTGIVTSVPSDSPDDYMTMHDLKSKPALRSKFRVKDDWILPYDIIPIINIPEFGDISAEKVCSDLKIKSQNEKDKLAEAKRLTYLKGFTEGTMLVGEFAGEKVEHAKSKVRQRLIETGQAIIYSEPEKKVMSRSGDECVVALTDQWYITYGESEWKKKAEECLANMNCFSEETRHGFEHTLGWLNQWACSRSFGLGTRIPWDEQFLVESLSDSTIYMAYYTVAHFLQNGDMYGSNVGSVKPEDLTDEVWDFLFCGGPYPQESAIDPNVLGSMKREFEYWYPIDLRVSGKDLVGNHLTFSIYNHTAIMEKRHWPQGFRCNGHILLNSEKMSKSTGNFRTLKQAIEEFSADATRFALADAGDGVDDANFVFETANAAILRLTKEMKWIKQVISDSSELRSGVPSTYADRVFQNEINLAVKLTDEHYRSYMFREALKTGFYDLQAARDEYRVSSEASGMKMNWDLVLQFLDVQTRLIAPICPHYAEFVWRERLKKEGFVIKAGWPSADPPDLTLKSAHKYLLDFIVLLRKNLQKQVNKKKIGGPDGVRVLIYVNENYEAWKVECLKILQSKFNSETRRFAPDNEIITALEQSEMLKASGFKQVQKLCMPFMRYKKDETRLLGPVALESRLPFRELEVLSENKGLIKKQLGFADIEVFSYSDPVAVEKAGTMATVLEENPPSPGRPTAIFLPSASVFC